MATYFFETITDAQAASFDATADNLVFGQTGERANTTTVVYNAATATAGASITLISGLTGKTVTFDAADFAGETPIFPDSSVLFVGDTNNNTNTGSDGGDGLYGGSGNDTLSGGISADLIQGNQGNDSLNGGSGADTLYGGQGTDTIDGDVGVNFIQGNSGADVLSVAATAGASSLYGGKDNDSITGGSAGDYLNGNSGNDTI
jgi:Ca2+-binding RTX toxin-like protein